MTKLFKTYILTLCIFFVPDVVTAQILIANPQIPTSELSRNNVRAIFAMRTPQWSDGTPIQVFVFEDANQTHISFCKHILGMFPYQLRRIWDRQVFSGTGVAPNTVKSAQEMNEKISNTPGAIGYIELEHLTDSVTQIGSES